MHIKYQFIELNFKYRLLFQYILQVLGILSCLNISVHPLPHCVHRGLGYLSSTSPTLPHPLASSLQRRGWLPTRGTEDAGEVSPALCRVRTSLKKTRVSQNIFKLLNFQSSPNQRYADNDKNKCRNPSICAGLVKRVRPTACLLTGPVPGSSD